MRKYSFFSKLKFYNLFQICISFFMVFSFLFAYVYGFNNKNIIINSYFDNISYTIEDKYEDVAHGLIDIESQNDLDIYNEIMYKTYNYKRYEGIQSYLFYGDLGNKESFSLVFKGFEDLEFKTNTISSRYYTDSNFKLEMIDIKLYKETSIKINRPVFYLPSSIADYLINYNKNDEFNTYDDLLDKLEVTILLNDNLGTPLDDKDYQNFKIRNIFLDEGKNSNFQVANAGYGENIKDFIGPYFISDSKIIKKHTETKLGFTTKKSFFSLKNFLIDYFYDNQSVDDASVEIYGIKDNNANLIYSTTSINSIFKLKPINETRSIISLFFSILFFLLAVTLLVISFNKDQVLKQKTGNMRNGKKILKKYVLLTLIPFLFIHLVYAIFFNKVHEIWIFRIYNSIGNAFTLFYTIMYLIILCVLFYLQFIKDIKKDEFYK